MKNMKLLFAALLLPLAITACSSGSSSSSGNNQGENNGGEVVDALSPYEVDTQTWNRLIKDGGAISPFSNVSITLEHGGIPFLSKDVDINIKINNGTVFVEWKEYCDFYLIFSNDDYNEKTGKYNSYTMIAHDLYEDKYEKGQAVGNYISYIMSGWVMPGANIALLNMDSFTYDEEEKVYSFSGALTTDQLAPLPTVNEKRTFLNTKIGFLDGVVQFISYKSKEWSQDFKLTFSDYGNTTFEIPDVE